MPTSYIFRSPSHLQLLVLAMISTVPSPSGNFTINQVSLLLLYFIWREGLLTRNYFLIRWLHYKHRLALLRKPFTDQKWLCHGCLAPWISPWQVHRPGSPPSGMHLTCPPSCMFWHLFLASFFFFFLKIISTGKQK